MCCSVYVFIFEVIVEEEKELVDFYFLIRVWIDEVVGFFLKLFFLVCWVVDVVGWVVEGECFLDL